MYGKDSVFLPPTSALSVEQAQTLQTSTISQRRSHRLTPRTSLVEHSQQQRLRQVPAEAIAGILRGSVGHCCAFWGSR